MTSADLKQETVPAGKDSDSSALGQANEDGNFLKGFAVALPLAAAFWYGAYVLATVLW